MKITTALAYENLRNDADSQNKIILHKDGKFYHVYEYSAWLLKTIVCTEEMQKERGDAKPLQVNRFVTNSVAAMDMSRPHDVWASVNSFLGILSHYASFNIRARMFLTPELLSLGTFNRDLTQFTLRR